MEWAQLCELAFLDDCDRLCVSIGDGDPAVLDIPVRQVRKPPQTGRHVSDNPVRPSGKPPWLSPPGVN
jgi:hypothetical protein